MSNTYKLALSVDELLAEARRITGIDIVDEDAREPLLVLCKSYNEESCLHEEGARVQQKNLLRILCNRLRMQRDFLAHPEISEEEIQAPVFLWGMPRTGTTKTQKLLAASGDFNWLTCWHSMNPCSYTGVPGEETQQRIEDVDEFTHWFETMVPDVHIGHGFVTHEPEEDAFILMQSLRSPLFLAFCQIPSYLGWLAEQDQAAQLRYLKDTLKYLQWQGLHTGSRPWVLKNPLYMGIEREIKTVFPNASLLMTHRDPKQSMPSSCSVMSGYYKAYSDIAVDNRATVGGFTLQMQQHMSLRESGEFKYIDLDYKEVAMSVESTMGKVYQGMGKQLSTQALDNMMNWDKQNPIHKKGKHSYTLEQYDLDAAQIDADFADYIAFYDSLTRM